MNSKRRVAIGASETGSHHAGQFCKTTSKENFSVALNGEFLDQ